MNRRNLVLVVSASLATVLATMLAPLSALRAEEGRALWLECGKVLDARGGALLGPHTIVVRGGRILEMSQRPEADDEAERIDLRGHTCLPGLMDMHTHLSSQLSPTSQLDRVRLTAVDLALRAVGYAEKTLIAGFTTVRDLGDSGNITVSMRNAIARGQIVGPRIFTAAKAIGTTGGHADPTNGILRDLAGIPGPADGVIDGPDEARKAVRQRYKDGADLIKITATGGVLSVAKNGQNPQLTEEEMRAIVDTARDYDMAVAAHAHGAEGMKRAIRAGVASIEHGTLMDDEVMRLMKEHGTYFVPTISAGRFVAEKAEEPGYFPEVIRPKAAAIGPVIQETAGKAYRAGVAIAFGTDAGVYPHGDNGKEFRYMVEAGIAPIDALLSATLHAAKLLGIDDHLGVLEAGYVADVVAVAGDPIADIETMEAVTFVMKDGRVYKRP